MKRRGVFEARIIINMLINSAGMFLFSLQKPTESVKKYLKMALHLDALTRQDIECST